MARLVASITERSFVHPKKHVFGRNFLTKPAPYLFSRPNWLYGAFRGKIVPDENIAQFCLKNPLEFVYPKNTFSVWIFVQNHTSPILWAKRTRWRDWWQVSRSEVLSIPKNTFSVRIFWRNQPHTSFLDLIGYMVRSGAKLFRTKTLLNFPQKPSQIRFSKKHVFNLNFCTKSHLTYFLGQTDQMARLGAKVFRSEVSFILKNTFSVGICWWNRPQNSFLSLIGYMVCSGSKLFRTKTLLNFASKAPSNSFFPKTRFRFEFLY